MENVVRDQSAAADNGGGKVIRTDGRLVHIYTGDGVGKTTAALGLALRAFGTGWNVLIVQFLKGRETGELAPLRKLGIPVLRGGTTKFISEMTPPERTACRAEQRRLFRRAREQAGGVDLLVLDEIFAAVSAGMVGEDELRAFVEQKPPRTELVLTGRNAPAAVAALADYVSDIRCIRHPYQKGVPARRGVEF